MKASSSGEWLDDFLAGFTAYYLTSLPVLAGVFFAVSFGQPTDAGDDPVAACFRFDAVAYRDIVQKGYSYDPGRRSLVAFFPGYPLLARWLGAALRIYAEEAALLTANIALLGTFVLLSRYVRVRWPEATAEQRGLVLAIFGLWPLGLFFRMPYTESMFVCGTLAVLYGMAREWLLFRFAPRAEFHRRLGDRDQGMDQHGRSGFLRGGRCPRATKQREVIRCLFCRRGQGGRVVSWFDPFEEDDDACQTRRRSRAYDLHVLDSLDRVYRPSLWAGWWSLCSFGL